MENLTQEVQPQPETNRDLISPTECPTCVSGLDPGVAGELFREALLESL